jgi:hypothetical protein
MTQPDPVLVVNFLSNYRIRAPEVLPSKMKVSGGHKNKKRQGNQDFILAKR